jgi:site-specific DNA-methyltransferase (adenine-specific)
MLSRMKFEIEQLVEEMIDQLPASVWTSDSTTFFDPAIGGGQFVRAIEQRLRAQGHSDENIRQRVFGFEESELHIRFAVNKHKLVGQYTRKPYEKFLELDNDMKFDVVVGNPPYEATTEDGRKDQANNLWSKFTKKSLESVEDNGHFAFIIPASWLSPAADIGKGKHGTRFFNDYFQKYKTLTININECARHFDVGSTFSYFVLEKTTAANFVTNVITADSKYNIDLRTIHYLPKTMNPLAISINKKVLDQPVKFGIVGNNLPESRLTESTVQSASFPIPAYHTSGKGGTYRYFKNPIVTANKPKVIISISGNYSPIYDLGGMSFTGMCVVYYLQNNDSMDSIKSYLNSKLIKFILDENKYTGWVSPVISDLPDVSKTKIWSDVDLYQHFKLTKDEIDYIESNVK